MADLTKRRVSSNSSGLNSTEYDAKLLDIGVLYARMSQALPRAINGNPIFGEVRVLHKDDWARASSAISRECARRANLEI